MKRLVIYKNGWFIEISLAVRHAVTSLLSSTPHKPRVKIAGWKPTGSLAKLTKTGVLVWFFIHNFPLQEVLSLCFLWCCGCHMSSTPEQINATCPSNLCWPVQLGAENFRWTRDTSANSYDVIFIVHKSTCNAGKIYDYPRSTRCENRAVDALRCDAEQRGTFRLLSM